MVFRIKFSESYVNLSKVRFRIRTPKQDIILRNHNTQLFNSNYLEEFFTVQYDGKTVFIPEISKISFEKSKYNVDFKPL